MKEKLKKIILFILNPKLLLCIGIAWIITNGWAYIVFGIGTFYRISWMIAVSSAYLTFLWFPFTPEKIVTMAIAILLLRLFFPNDEQTLAILKDLLNKAKSKIKSRKHSEK